MDSSSPAPLLLLLSNLVTALVSCFNSDAFVVSSGPSSRPHPTEANPVNPPAWDLSAVTATEAVIELLTA